MGDYLPLSRTVAARQAALTRAARPVAREVLAALAQAGARALLMGSAARGDMHADSDLDILVLDAAGLAPTKLLAIAEAAAAGRYAVDVVLAEDLSPRVRALMLAEAIDERALSGR